MNFETRARAHREWFESALLREHGGDNNREMVMSLAEYIERVAGHYEDALVHGYKHGLDDKASALIKIMDAEG